MASPKDDERTVAVVPSTSPHPEPETAEVRTRPGGPPRTPPGIWPPMSAAALVRGRRSK